MNLRIKFLGKTDSEAVMKALDRVLNTDISHNETVCGMSIPAVVAAYKWHEGGDIEPTLRHISLHAFGNTLKADWLKDMVLVGDGACEVCGSDEVVNGRCDCCGFDMEDAEFNPMFSLDEILKMEL